MTKEAVIKGEYYLSEGLIRDGFIYAEGCSVEVPSTLTPGNISVTVAMDNLTLREKLSGVISPYMAGEATEFTDELIGEVMALFEKEDARKLIDRCIEEAIKKNCRPGGVIYNAIRR